MSLPVDIATRLSLPLIAAPMFLVSGVELVAAACGAGIIGAFPTANCRTVEELDAWMEELRRRAAENPGAPICPNLIVHHSNARLMEDVAVLVRHRVELVIASVGSPRRLIPPLHDAGCRVFTDIASLRHAERAIAVGSDGLILLTAGAGGQTGWANPFAFARAVRAIWDGPLVLAGGVSDGQALYAARALGCDLAYMGTQFIATRESLAAPAYKRMLVNSRLDDILLTCAFTGLETNMLRPSIAAAGLDPDALPTRGTIEVGNDINPEKRRWRDVWSAGHSVSGVTDIPGVAELVDRTHAEYEAARAVVAGV